MSETDLMQSAVDSLDSGLPDRPDVAAVRVAGLRQRRRRRMGWTAAAAAAVAAITVPALVLAGGVGLSHDSNHVTASDPARVAGGPPALASAGLAGPEFGTGMQAAVQRAFPDAQLREETLGDGWAKSGKDYWDWTVQSPPNWATLFAWEQTFDLSGGRTLDVVATRVTPGSNGLGDPGPTSCDQIQYPAEQSCSVQTVGSNTVVVNNGVQFDSKPGNWYRYIEIFYDDATRGTTAHVGIGTWVHAASWAQADQELPSVDQMVALGREQALVLPAPDHYPAPNHDQ